MSSNGANTDVLSIAISKPAIKSDPVDSRSYSSLLVEDQDAEDDIAVKGEPGAAIIKQEHVGNVVIKTEPAVCVVIKKGPGQHPYEDAEPICAISELAKKTYEEPEPISTAELQAHAAKANDVHSDANDTISTRADAPGSSSNFVDLTTSDDIEKALDEAAMYLQNRPSGIRLYPAAVNRPSALWRPQRNLQIDANEKPFTAIVRPARKEPAESSDGKPKFYKPSEFATRIGRVGRIGDVPEWAKEHARRDEQYERSLHRERRGIKKSVKPQTTQSPAQREKNQYYADEGLANSSGEVKSTPPSEEAPNATDESNTMEVDTSGPCICQSEKPGKMVRCANVDCKKGWFHFECMGLKDHSMVAWFCPSCENKPLSELIKPRLKKFQTISLGQGWRSKFRSKSRSRSEASGFR